MLIEPGKLALAPEDVITNEPGAVWIVTEVLPRDETLTRRALDAKKWCEGLRSK